jgi:hypothetical protein
MQWKFFPQGLLFALALSAASVSKAATFTWDGGGVDDNWSTAANWSTDVAPSNDGTAAIVFSGATPPLTSSVNANWDVSGLSFDAIAGAFTVGGNQLTIEAGGVTNNSAIAQTINNPIVMGAAQTWNAISASLTFGGTVNTSGFPLTISGGKGTTFNAPVTSAGMTHVMTGSTANFKDSLANSGSLVVDSSASVAVSQPYAAPGSIINGGSILFESDYTGTLGIAGNGSTFFAGVVSTGVGNTASLNFGGSVTIYNELDERLAGPATNQYDSLNVAGILSMNGTLRVNLAGGFMPAAGNSFGILHWGVRTGSFNVVNLPALGSGLAWSTLKLFSEGSISVVDANLIPGDFNHDFRVDAADIAAMAGALRDLSGYESGRGLSDSQLRQVADLNNDGKVDNRDCQALLSFEAQLLATGVGSITAVPEPKASLLMAIGALAIAASRKRGRRRVVTLDGGV